MVTIDIEKGGNNSSIIRDSEHRRGSASFTACWSEVRARQTEVTVNSVVMSDAPISYRINRAADIM